MPSFELDKNVNYNNRIVYNYPKVNINKNEITATSTKLEMTFYNGSTDPNIIYTLEGANIVYNHKKAYLYKLIHKNIIGITNGNDAENNYGELVIEHSPPGSTNKIYVCFLLEFQNTDVVKDIDTLINFEKQTTLMHTGVELNSVLPKPDGCIIYDSTVSNIKSTVFLFTTPIKVNNASKARIRMCSDVADSLFAPYAESYMVIPATNISLPDPDQIYINCNPTGESTDTIDTYSIPINSLSGSEQDARSAMQTMTLFAIFTIISVGLVAFVPGIYQLTVLAWAIKEGTDKDTTVASMRAYDIAIALLFGIVTFILIIVGFVIPNNIALSVGFSLFYITAASAWLLNIRKNDKNYMKVNDGGKIEYKLDTNGEIEYIFPGVKKVLLALWAVTFGGLFSDPAKKE
jgi:hypothetical protein